MRRAPIPLVLLLSAALPSGAAAATPAPVAELTTCRTDPSAAGGRYAVFTGSMPALTGTERMSMRFDLLQRRAASSTFTPIAVPKWGRWETSRPGRSSYTFSRRVNGLAPGTDYSAVVRFRWYGEDGALQRSARRVSATCRQPETRPDLRAAALGADRGAEPGTATYTYVVRNAGKGLAGPFDLVLTVSGTRQPAQRLGGLDPGEEQVVTLVGPVCQAGSTVSLAVDASAEVDERDESDNVVVSACPFTA
jgi:CARDB